METNKVTTKKPKNPIVVMVTVAVVVVLAISLISSSF